MAGILLPVPPEKISYKIKNNNKTIDLVNGGAVNVLRQPGLTDVSFTLLIPCRKYPFSHPEGFVEQDYYLTLFQMLKTGLQPFKFNIHRIVSNTTELAEVEMTVSLESYTVTEKAEGMGDVEVEISLKEYAESLTSCYVVENGVAKEITNRASNRTVPSSYTVKRGDSLWAIAKMQLGDETKWKSIAEKNGIKMPYTVMPGQVIKLG
jgi:LysM repeat protein